jgi:NTE family protein
MDEGAMQKKLGLALGGGAALGLAHIGVLSVLEEAGLRPSFLAGSSAGALAAAFYCAGASIGTMRQIALRLHWKGLQKTTLPILALGTNEPLGHFLKHLLPVRDFDALRLPLRIVTTDLLTAEMVVFEGGPPFHPRGMIDDPDIVFDRGDLIEAVRASCARPVITHPVRIGERLLVDGGLSCNVPGQLTRDMGADVVVAVDLHTRRWKNERPRNLIAYAAQAQAIFQHWTIKSRRIAADVVIRPDFSALSSPEFSEREAIIRCGEEAARAAVPRIRALLSPAPGPAVRDDATPSA